MFEFTIYVFDEMFV